MKILFRSFAIFVSVVLITVNLSSCNKNNETDSLKSDSEPTSSLKSNSEPKETISVATPDEVLNEIYSEDERETLENYIYQTAIDSRKTVPSIAVVIFYNNHLEECDKLAKVGLRGAPLLFTGLMDRHIVDVLQYQDTNYFIEVLCAILRTDPSVLQGAYLRFKEMDPNFINYHTFSKEGVSFLYKEAKTQIPKVIESDTDFSDKAMKLLTYGVFSIPYVVQEIEKGNKEYEQFFVGLGLHVDVPEFKRRMPNYFLSWQERFDSKEFLEGSEDFNYKTWLSENEKDLNNLFKFLDAYCAEYEAENK